MPHILEAEQETYDIFKFFMSGHFRHAWQSVSQGELAKALLELLF